MISEQQIKKKTISPHERDDKKIWITATKPADPMQEPEAWETGLMSTGSSVLQSVVERENGQRAGYSEEAVWHVAPYLSFDPWVIKFPFMFSAHKSIKPGITIQVSLIMPTE